MPKEYQSFTYATEADVLNVAMFNMTAKQQREANSNLDTNIRSHATLQQLIILSNLKRLNAEMIRQGIGRNNRLMELNRIVKDQMASLIKSAGKNG